MTTTNPADPPDPYAAQQPAFPHRDLYDVRPQGSALRRGRGWMLAGAIGLMIVGVVASDWMTDSRPAVASNGLVKSFGVYGIPEEKAVAEMPKPPEQDAKKEEVKKAKAAPKKREKVLGMANAFEDPSRTRANREVSSWNSSGSGKRPVANQRQSILGN